jgi:hypothetical protein
MSFYAFEIQYLKVSFLSIIVSLDFLVHLIISKHLKGDGMIVGLGTFM